MLLQNACPGADIQEMRSDASSAGLLGYAQAYQFAKKHAALVRRADVLVLQGFLNPGSIPLARAAQKFGVPYVVVPRGDLVPSWRFLLVARNPWRKWAMWMAFARRRIERATALVTSSDLELQRIIAIGGRVDHAHIIPDPMLTEYDSVLAESASPPTAAAEDRSVLFLGRFSVEKNIPFLVRLWPRVLKSVPDAKLVLAGPIDHPTEAKRVDELIAYYGLQDRVEIIRWLAGEKKREHLARARCVVLPSFYESFGQTVVESLLNRTPCVVSDGTPWYSLPSEAGHRLPLIESLWAERLKTLLQPAQKQWVSPRTVETALAFLDTDLLVERWARVLRSALECSRLG